MHKENVFGGSAFINLYANLFYSFPAIARSKQKEDSSSSRPSPFLFPIINQRENGREFLPTPSPLERPTTTTVEPPPRPAVTVAAVVTKTTQLPPAQQPSFRRPSGNPDDPPPLTTARPLGLGSSNGGFGVSGTTLERETTPDPFEFGARIIPKDNNFITTTIWPHPVQQVPSTFIFLVRMTDGGGQCFSLVATWPAQVCYIGEIYLRGLKVNIAALQTLSFPLPSSSFLFISSR